MSCFADSVDADTATLIGIGGFEELPRVISTWNRGEESPAPAWTPGSFLARALTADTAVVDLGAAAGGSAAPVRAAAAAVRANRRALGALHAGLGAAPTLSADALCWRADSYARIAALCIEGDLALRAAFHLPRADDLTGCLTYGSLIEAVNAELQRSARRGHAVSCCFIDLNGFKRINDERGHLEGNRVLSAVGRAMRAVARKYDTVGRFGGDEFVVLLPETDMAGARRVAERLRAGVRAAVSSETQVEVDVTIGIAEWDRETSPIGLLDKADRALADAKRNGIAVATNGRNGAGPFDRVLAKTRSVLRPGGTRDDRRARR